MKRCTQKLIFGGTGVELTAVSSIFSLHIGMLATSGLAGLPIPQPWIFVLSTTILITMKTFNSKVSLFISLSVEGNSLDRRKLIVFTNF